MNRIFSIVWSEVVQAFVVVSEHAKRRGKSAGSQMGECAAVIEGELVGCLPTRLAPRTRPSMFALEARIMFDGAAVATADAVLPHADDHPALPSVAPVAVSVAPAIEAPVIAARPLPSTDQQGITGAAEALATQPTAGPLAENQPAPTAASEGADLAVGNRETAIAQEPISSNSINEIHQVLVVDSRVPDYQQFVDAAEPGVKVVVLDLDHDGVKQIADALEGLKNIDSISIVSHGDEGLILLGDSPLFGGNLAEHGGDLARIGAALSADGDITLYGCNVGAGSSGQAFIHELALATGADIAASIDDTGTATRGGNWDLEITSGTVASPTAINTQFLSDWDHLASTGSANSQATLVSAISAAVSDGSDDTITLTGDFTVTSAITINVNDGKTLTIVGAGHKIDGNNASRVFVTTTTNAGSTISMQNLTIANGFWAANGGDSLSSGAVAGGDALGAAISNSGTLNLSGITFSGNKASGGGGGAAGPGGQSGGGGGGGGFGTTKGGAGGNNDTYSSTSSSAGKGGNGAGTNSAPEIGGYGGTTTGGKAGALAGGSTGGKGATASDGTNSIGGGGGGGGNYAAGGRGGNAVAVLYNNGGTVKISGSTFSNNIAAGGGGGGGSVYANFPGNGGNGGYGVSAIWNKSGTVSADSSTKTSITGGTNVGKIPSLRYHHKRLLKPLVICIFVDSSIRQSKYAPVFA